MGQEAETKAQKARTEQREGAEKAQQEVGKKHKEAMQSVAATEAQLTANKEKQTKADTAKRNAAEAVVKMNATQATATDQEKAAKDSLKLKLVTTSNATRKESELQGK